MQMLTMFKLKQHCFNIFRKMSKFPMPCTLELTTCFGFKVFRLLEGTFDDLHRRSQQNHETKLLLLSYRCGLQTHFYVKPENISSYAWNSRKKPWNA